MMSVIRLFVLLALTLSGLLPGHPAHAAYQSGPWPADTPWPPLTAPQWIYKISLEASDGGRVVCETELSVIDGFLGHVESISTAGQTRGIETRDYDVLQRYPDFLTIVTPLRQPGFEASQLSPKQRYRSKEGDVATSIHAHESGGTTTVHYADAWAHYSRLIEGSARLRLADLDLYVYIPGAEELRITISRSPYVVKPGTPIPLSAIEDGELPEPRQAKEREWERIASYEGAYHVEDLRWLRPDGSSTDLEDSEEAQQQPTEALR